MLFLSWDLKYTGLVMNFGPVPFVPWGTSRRVGRSKNIHNEKASTAQDLVSAVGVKGTITRQLVNFQGANGLGIEYSGYVEINLQIPERRVDEDILLLVVPHIQYHNYVPVTLGTLTLELINQHFVDK